MPLFDFQCRKCSNVFEEMIPMGSKTFSPCPACGSEDIEKLIVPPAVHFKGSGFYKTDTSGTIAKVKTESAGTTETTSESSGTEAEKKSKK